MKQCHALLLSFSVLFLLASSSQAGPQLVSDIPMPDPQVLRIDGQWFIFGTGAQPYFLHGTALEPKSMKRTPLQLNYGSWPHKVHHIWKIPLRVSITAGRATSRWLQPVFN